MGDRDPPNERVYRKVWCQFVPPRRAFNAMVDWNTGILTISGEGVEFCSPKFSFRTGEVLAVRYGSAGNDIVNGWVTLDYRTENGDVGRVFINDGRLLGYRAILTGSTRRIGRVLRGLVVAGPNANVEAQPEPDRLTAFTRTNAVLVAALLTACIGVSALARGWTRGLIIALVFAWLVLLLRPRGERD